MLTVLIVRAAGSNVALVGVSPSIEILHADGLEKALETLGRNRRIDAILLCAGRENAQIASAIREDNTAPPPIFAAEPAPSGVRPLPSGSPTDLLSRLLEIL